MTISKSDYWYNRTFYSLPGSINKLFVFLSSIQYYLSILNRNMFIILILIPTQNKLDKINII